MRPIILALATHGLVLLIACGPQAGPGAPATDPGLEEIERRILANPKEPGHFVERARYFDGSGNTVEAIKDWRRAIAMDSLNSGYHTALGELFYRELMLEEAEFHLTKAMLLSKDKAPRLALAELMLAKREYRRAMDLVNDALRLDPGDARGYRTKGWIHMEAGDTALAVSSFRTAVERDPDYYEVFVMLGMLHGIKADPMALEYYNSALEVRPEGVEALYGKGMYAQEQGMDSVALACYARIKEADPTNALAWYNSGYVLLEHLGDVAAARAEFDMAVRLWPTYPEAYYNRGRTYELEGRLDSALIDFKRALALAPDMDLAAEGLGRLRGRGVRVDR